MCFGSKIPESWRKFVTRQLLIDVALNLSSIIKAHSPWNGFRLSSQRERKALGYNTPQLDKKRSQVGSRHIGFAWRFICFGTFQVIPTTPKKSTSWKNNWTKYGTNSQKHLKAVNLLAVNRTLSVFPRLVQVTSIIKSLANANRCRSPADKVAVQSRASWRPHFRNSGPIMARLGCGGFKWTKKRKETLT